MPKKTGWELLQAGNLRGALRVLKEEYRRNSFKGSLNNIGTCHLCLGDAQAAKKVFDESIDLPLPDTGTHALAGIARWVLGEREEAVRVWCKGLDCDYRDAAGGMELPLLLFYASARQPESFPSPQSKELIIEALRSRWATNWPGPLGRFALREIDENRVRQEAKFVHPLVEARQLNEVEFYAGVVAYLSGDKAEFMDRMRRCAAARECELNNEWHLARYEVINVKVPELI